MKQMKLLLLLLVMTVLTTHCVHYKPTKKQGNVLLNKYQKRYVRTFPKGAKYKHLTGTSGDNPLERASIKKVGINRALFQMHDKQCTQNPNNFLMTGGIPTHAAPHVRFVGIQGNWVIPMARASNSGASSKPTHKLRYAVTAIKLP